ncbi:hypothetical protein BV22DRAFT_1197072 [Leucogyrophana mollusca]|uniref:Uncharacterized protein n=1 Tax=Leucogyrophana mollusca TaxID=85980 RepID=A0ACB8BCP3_9AGAM|nr:hypothetical protein BV22DRAFT_1197072 [Leucogyrophana mollusca]
MTAPRYDEQDSQLIADLHKLSKKSPKLVRSTTYNAPSDPEITVRSWKMNEFKYYDVPSPFPTLARGLFTREIDESGESSDKPRYSIVARGYDKFFNIGEVPWTSWSSLEKHTGPPYTLSLKSNGCIIFIAAISVSKLIVTSKHALGPLSGVGETHSEAGHRWLLRHLAEKGKLEEDLAKTLWEKNWTAIAELCDDSFEEHVLPYPAEKSGLHLHGINENAKDFQTLPTSTVDAFADEWGFIKTATTTLNTIPEVKAFTDEISKTGKWNGEALEGFVVRTRIIDPSTKTDLRDNPPPYAPGSSFFFKVKFDEPYMMYRDWREVTKMLLSTKESLDSARLPNSKLKRKETKLYVQWVKNEIRTNPCAFSGFTKGKGIIAIREKFLEWMESNGDKALEVEADSNVTDKKFGKTIIVPVAIPGCGKTAVSIALAHLFGFGHTQSDDVPGKKTAATFIKNVVSLLVTHDVVIADKNNHLVQHRRSLREAVSGFQPPVRLLALNWALDRPPAMIHRICGDRVLTRGDNHQSLRADTVAKSHEDIIWQFIHTTEELSDSEVDKIIDMDNEDTLEQAVDRAVEGCVSVLGVQRPTKEEVEEAVRVAIGYVPATKKPDETKTQKKKKDAAALTPRFYGLLPEVDLEEAVGRQIEDASDVPLDGKDFWRNLVSQKRLSQRPHSTLVHKNELPGQIELWERCSDIDRMAIPPSFKFSLGHVVWDKRVMAVTVDDFQVDQPGTATGQEGQEFVSKLSEEIRGRLHITLGTSDDKVPPFEAMALVKAWRLGKRAGVGSLELEGLDVQGRIKRWSY